MSESGGRVRAYSSDAVHNRPGWDDRHHLLFARENQRHPKGQRDYFDRPRDLRICVPHGHDGISTPYELRPSLHWLKYSESPKMAAVRAVNGQSPKSGAPSPTSDRGSRSPAARSPKAGPLHVHHRIHVASEDHHVDVGSPTGSPAKPRFQKTASWLLEPEKLSSSQKREDKYRSTHYSEKHGVMRYKERACKEVPWNNRWHLNPSNFGQSLHGHYREYFDHPSRMYTSSGEDWRHMYGDGCELLNTRTPGQPFVKPAYGWHSLRLQDKLGADSLRATM